MLKRVVVTVRAGGPAGLPGRASGTPQHWQSCYASAKQKEQQLWLQLQWLQSAGPMKHITVALLIINI